MSMSMSKGSASGSGLIRSHPYAPPADTGLDIAYQDKHLLAINKPAGLLAVPGRGPELQDCALYRAQKRFPQALMVHRLDEATSGLLLFALSPSVQKALSHAFETKKIRKRYLAWVHGIIDPPEGKIDAPIRVDWARRPLRVVDQESGQSAVTAYRLLQKDDRSAQCQCTLEPETGRTHQLRVHLAHLGHPIVGDRLYGPSGDADGRLMLHAQSLIFEHPVHKAVVRVSTNAPLRSNQISA